ncbi:MAG: PspC domain-containing protein [Acidimicrobiales bacterium]
MRTTSYQGVQGSISELRRPLDGRMLGGVAAGIAEHFDLDPNIVRLGLVVLAAVGGAGIPLYLAAWLLIPEEGSEASLAAELLSRASDR